VLLGVALLVVAAPLSAQQRPWHDQWFWGAQAGVHRYFTPTNRWETGYTVGVNWLITGKRMGLLMAYDQILYDNATSVINDPTSGTGTRTVQFDNGRYLKGSLVAMPLDGPLQFMLGAGFVIHNISDASVQGTFATPEDQARSQALVDDASTRAFWDLMAGFNFMLGSRAAIFGHLEFLPSTENFLITAEQFTFAGGIRYSFGSRREEITTER
jgi:hypothetical protein